MAGKNDRKKRAPNFTSAEMAILLDEVRHHKGVLFHSFRTTVSNKQKMKCGKT